MESSLRYNRRRSGYEPSDTETDWHESPRRRENNGYDQSRSKSSVSRLQLAMLETDTPISIPARKRHSKSPYRPPRGHDNGNVNNSDFRSRRTCSDIRRNISPISMSEQRRTNPLDNNNGNACPFSQSESRTNPDNNTENIISPFSISERRRYMSPLFKPVAESGHGLDYGQAKHDDASWGREISTYSRRAASAPRSRLRERSQQMSAEQQKQDKTQDEIDVSPHKHGPSVGEINEMVANARISKGLNGHVVSNFDCSIDSMSPGDIFFSRDYNNGFQNVVFPKNGTADRPGTFLPKPPGFVGRNPAGSHQGNKVNEESFNPAMSQTTTNSTSAVSRQSSIISDSSGRTSASTTRFVANRRKSQSSDSWFSCIKKGSCKTSHKSPEKDRPFDEASFIGKAVVVESLRPLWADKHQPVSLLGFTCHKNEAQLLQQLATAEIFPHILLKGPPGTGKKALTMALLREIYGDPVWNISHDLRYFHILESRPMQVAVPVSLSPHHVELNVYLESKAAYALTALVKQISSEYAVTPDISAAPIKANYKVLVLYDVDKAAENIQHLIKWIMDCYADSCKLILCCEDDVGILESVKSRCKVIKVEAPATHEVIEVLIQIAKKEGFELSMSFAAKIANKSKQNLRKAIMALEACKLHNYPFADDQPIPLEWEEAIVELAADILAEPFPKRLLIIRGKIQKLLADFVHPKLILLKLVEQFLCGVEASLKREIYYWYAYYDKRLPSGTSALLKLEEFVVKFMSIYRKSSSNRQFS